MNISGEKKGQVTIFVVIGLIIVVAAILLILFFPSVKEPRSETENPRAYLEDCLKEDIEKTIKNVSLHGGEVNPELTYKYNGTDIRYLCYTEEYHRTCIVQETFLRKSIEEEIKEDISNNVRKCFTEMEESFEGRGYDTNLKKGDYEISLKPERIEANFDYSLSLSQKEKQTQNIDKFSILIDSDLYELVSVTNSIINWEVQYGDVETTSYMNYYRDLKVEKKKQPDGTTVYILTNRDSGDKFQFASRSNAWPPGYTG